jgi:hypothetical protein
MLAAFSLTSGLAIIAVLCAYLSGSLDDSSVNYIDRKIMHHALRLWTHLFPNRPSHDLPEQFSQLQAVAIRRLRRDGIIKFIVDLSDQQLVTGVAILLAGVINIQYLTRFEFIIIHSLAWFSSTTHIATLSCLCEYFHAHHVTRLSRTVGVVCFVALLVASIIIRALIAMSGAKPATKVWCALQFNDTRIAEGSNWYGAFNLAWQCSWLIVLLLVVFGYLVRIQDFFYGNRDPSFSLTWLCTKITQFNNKAKSFTTYYEERRAEIRLRRLIHHTCPGSWYRYMPFGYDDSFLSTIPGIAFSFFYGLTQVAAARFDMKVRLDPSSEWGYGQIMTILMLCMPCVTAIGSYSGKYITADR